MTRYYVKDYMTLDPVVVHPNDSLIHVRKLMLRYNVNRVIVIEDSKPIGIFTQKDFARVILEGIENEHDIDEVLVKDVMTKNIITTYPDESLVDAARTMVNKAISSLVVLDPEDETLEGILTKTDLCNFYKDKCAGLALVREFMTENVVTVKPYHSAMKVIDLLARYNISRIVVVEKRKPVGIITIRDVTFSSPFIMREYHLRKAKYIRERGRRGVVKVPLIPLAEDLMTPDPITVRDNEDLVSAARLMIHHGISGLPVVNEKEDLVGIVTKTDIVRAITARVK
ncbi:MAG: hypothetical protein DRJ52_02910 [Thermoprotei archaeon]|nr:MAG: hypothetical protein DRJ52_02910 [Thermoprotei archaeon]RLF00845.1 MAG: hypothetical protein DRJ63_01085 [Thermoprotei archaeon]HDI75072.1 CBS domain-containing protein [Thermoprotei archaeon]